MENLSKKVRELCVAASLSPFMIKENRNVRPIRRQGFRWTKDAIAGLGLRD